MEQVTIIITDSLRVKLAGIQEEYALPNRASTIRFVIHNRMDLLTLQNILESKLDEMVRLLKSNQTDLHSDKEGRKPI